jgi:hypothetical protein
MMLKNSCRADYAGMLNTYINIIGHKDLDIANEVTNKNDGFTFWKHRKA